jgi:hypothetical protein
MPFDSVVSATALDGAARGSGLANDGKSAKPTNAPRVKLRRPNKSVYLSKKMLIGR